MSKVFIIRHELWFSVERLQLWEDTGISYLCTISFPLLLLFHDFSIGKSRGMNNPEDS